MATMIEETPNPRHLHMIHIPKTGGTAVVNALRGKWDKGSGSPGDWDLQYRGHEQTLPGLLQGEWFFFAVRDPVDKFVSKFYDRRREGGPSYSLAWTPDEAMWFERFPTAEALALALPSADAQAAIETFDGVNSHYANWLGSPEYLLERSATLLAILRQSHLAQDFAAFAHLIGLPEATLPREASLAHRAPRRPVALSPRAAQNVREWFADDYAFAEVFEELSA
jgi:hypothetical protein